jgi:hypothetical protein
MLGGWVLAAVRFGFALLRVLLVFARLDIPISGDHKSDPGYRSYISLVRCEAGVHAHPVAVVAVAVVWQAVAERRKKGKEGVGRVLAVILVVF